MKALKPFEQKGYSQYGASMGRMDCLPDDRTEPVKLRMEKLRMYDGAYDKGGAYWGMGTPLYCAWGHDSNGDSVCLYVRAHLRRTAIAKVLSQLPNAIIRP